MPISSDYYRRLQVDKPMPITTQTVTEYALGAGGRLCDLPPNYLDAVAAANLRVYPYSLPIRLADLLVSGRFRRSHHPLARDLSLAELRADRSRRSSAACAAWRERHGDRARYRSRVAGGQISVV